jgi:hypothetical protein
MKQAEVKIGMVARVKIGSRLAEVTVLRQIDDGGYKSRIRFECRTADTGRTIRATAARLRPLPGGRTMAAPAHGGPAVETMGGEVVRPGAIPGVKLNPLRVIEQMGPRNAQGIMRFTGSVYVGTPLLWVCRQFVQSIGRRSLRQFPPAFRRGALHCLLAHHTFNQQQYREVMGSRPVPTQEMVAAALMGDAAARAAVLAG